ncbi:MAG: glycerol kinase GlpK [Planctomycetales bacterium]|nr:glycerol kinase GlpK [Planctomycetales bacterium]
MSQFVLALDQGTTSSRAIVFDHSGAVRSIAQQEFRQIHPAPGVVEHDAEEIWNSQLSVAQQALQRASLDASDIAAIGVTNQRETTILWDAQTGEPLAHAMVWQSRASAPICEQLKADGHDRLVRERTGLLIDPYFSASKIKHLLDANPSWREQAQRGKILFGTVDSWLIWRLTGGRRHVTDASNASRTMLMNLHSVAWDDELLEILDIPRAMLPEIRSSSELYGETAPELFGSPIPIAAAAGDQQAATFGQTCFTPGSAKNTYGTGCFLVMNTGSEPKFSSNSLLSTVGWKIGESITYCLEGSVFVGGAVVGWLRDGLGIISKSSEVEALAASVPDCGDVYFVPALAGLGAPYWDPYARGTIIGITGGTKAAHIARAALEAMAFQSRDLVEAMQADAGAPLTELKVDGGASADNLLMQIQADQLGAPVRRPVVAETTALGAAYLAGLAVGYWKSTDEIAANWALDQEFKPQTERADADRAYARWRAAVERSRDWAKR